MDWGDSQVKQTPFVIPPIFEGNRLVLYGIFDEIPKKTKVTLSAESSNGNFSTSLEIDPEVKTNANIIKLAAKSMIKDLEEGKSYLHKEADRIKAEAIQKAVSYTHLTLPTT
eukprot:TRINITY_DN4475_c0_g1_i1.p1 TRINITY_DN4475_c0_g1~~TRINITY_DN4475_c0_g1_i1.p1  ORF type:complete len:112 (-),score=38.40 TRINITY_DN4475_c0_g1_i1:32-367(-)